MRACDEDPPLAEPDAGRVRECVEALDRLGVPLDAGAPTAREALRTADYRFGNDTIAAAVKAPRTAAKTCPGQSGARDRKPTRPSRHLPPFTEFPAVTVDGARLGRH